MGDETKLNPYSAEQGDETKLNPILQSREMKLD